MGELRASVNKGLRAPVEQVVDTPALRLRSSPTMNLIVIFAAPEVEWRSRLPMVLLRLVVGNSRLLPVVGECMPLAVQDPLTIWIRKPD